MARCPIGRVQLVHLEQLGGARPHALQTISETAQLAAIPRTVPGSATDTQTAPPGGRDTDRVPVDRDRLDYSVALRTDADDHHVLGLVLRLR